MERIDDHQKAYVCIHVFKNEKPVLLVSRPEGDWCFLCGEGHDDEAASYRVVGIGHLFELDSSLHSITDLPPDWEAERDCIGGVWRKSKIE